MVYIGTCDPCKAGDHARHETSHHTPEPGPGGEPVYGGGYCPCQGECQAPPFAKQAGVAWWGRRRSSGTCQCCQKAAPVYTGYNGGQPMAVTACATCTTPGHPACDLSAGYDLGEIAAALHAEHEAGHPHGGNPDCPWCPR